MTAILILSLWACMGAAPVNAGERGALRVSHKTTLEWQPGDVIPGWEAYDYDCPNYVGAEWATVDYPDVWAATFGVGTDVRYDGIISEVIATVADCADKTCTGEDVYPPNAPRATTFGADASMRDVFDKTGFYIASARPDAYTTGAASLPVGAYADQGPNLVVELCLSKIRPDEMSGVTYVTYRENLPYLYYPRAVVQYPFDHIFADHAAVDYDYGNTRALGDLAYLAVSYGGDIDYDNAWDWDAITDPDIRAALYDRYTPINLP